MGPAMWLPLAAVLLLGLLPATADQPEMLVPDMIEAEGYSAETHEVQTEDGYLLQMHRIPGGSVSPPSKGKPPVLLQHGILSSSQDWLVSDSEPHSALGYMLADEGYDVWLGNTRGNFYSDKHMSMSSSDNKFWHFSLHEQAVYDLPAMIDYILEVTGHKELFFVGHSSANALFYMMASARREYNAKVRLQFSLSPLAFINKVRSLRDAMFRAIIAPVQSLAKRIAESNLFGSFSTWMERLTILCKNGIGRWDICAGNFNKIWKSMEDIELVPLDSIVHFSQMLSSGIIQQFDYGETGNLMHYDSALPPAYDLGLVTCEVVLVASMGDILAPLEDMELLKAKLSKVRELISIKLSEFDYRDFLTSFKSKTLVYHRIVDIMRSEWNWGDNIQVSLQVQKKDSLTISEQKEMKPDLLIIVGQDSSTGGCSPDEFQGNGSDCQTMPDYSYYGDYDSEEFLGIENKTDEQQDTPDDYADDYSYNSSENISTSAYPSYDDPENAVANETVVATETNGQVDSNVTTGTSFGDTALPVSVNTLPAFSEREDVRTETNKTDDVTSPSVLTDLVTTSPSSGVTYIKPENENTTATKSTKTTMTSTSRILSPTTPGSTEKPRSSSEVSSDVSQHSNIDTTTKAITQQTQDNTNTLNNVSSVAESSMTTSEHQDQTITTISTINAEYNTSHTANMTDTMAAESTSTSSSTVGCKILTIVTTMFVYQFQITSSY